MIVTENELDEWVRGHGEDAQGMIVELVWRLVAASSPKPKERRFPLGDSVGQHGPDGLLNVDLAYDPFVPEGRSFWEIGTGRKAGAKATSDYNDLLEALPKSTRSESTFVFVTPLSGRRDWEHTWKEDSQGAWLEERRAKGEWRDVRVIDGTKLIDWTHQFPPVALWLAQRTKGIPPQQVETPEQRWNLVRTFGEPPPLSTKLFLAGRDEACNRLKDMISGTVAQLKLETHFPDHVVDFVCAYLAALDSETRADAAGRWLIVSGSEAWNAMAAQTEKLVLIADSALDLSGESGTKLIQKARRNGHAVIFGGPGDGIPDPASIPLRAPRAHQIQEALQQGGYGEERARNLAQKSGGNLGSLLRCIQNLSLMPEWAEGTQSSELAIAAVLGTWSEESPADQAVVEYLSGKSYGEWIGAIREVALRPGTPLTQRDGTWRFGARYEGWYALGPRLFDQHLARLQTVAALVLKERDPQFDLPHQERYAASIHGKVLAHSHLIRNGLAESLALLGSQSKALTSCSLGKPELTAMLTVRETLADTSWERWASLNDVLPLLAEAAPNEFLAAVESALMRDPCPFDGVFAEEGSGFMGRTYMSGLLWALETLAWDADHLSRVVLALGALAAKDPGGQWGNRPSSSLTTILLPWLPQTCAPIAKRAAAVTALVSELPGVGWDLIVSLLPQSHSSSTGTRRPAWRQTIPEDWPNTVSGHEYWEQVTLYAEMAITAAEGDRKKLAHIIGHLEDLPPPAYKRLLTYLASDVVTEMPETDRLELWNALVDLAAKHRKFADAAWAMKSDQVAAIASIAATLAPKAPSLRHQRLFSERDLDLYEEKGNYEAQHEDLERRRQIAVQEVAKGGGTRAVLAFAGAVQSPWRVGIAFGAVADPGADLVLPSLLASDQKYLSQFADGFVRSRFRVGGWNWVDAVSTEGWMPSQTVQFLTFLPFAPATWDRAASLLGPAEDSYWKTANATPYEIGTHLDRAVEQLIRYGRPSAALHCLYYQVLRKNPVNVALAVQALLAAVKSSESVSSLDAYQTTEIIETLQNDPTTPPDDLFQIEWAYLPLLDRHAKARPKLLERRLATDPAFFCEVIRLVFRSRNDPRPLDKLSGKRTTIATNAYRLLSQWRSPPGSHSDGTYSGEELKTWLDAVTNECVRTGHLEIAMTMLGHVLTHVPPDRSGLWLDRSAAAVLNAKDAADMRAGFRTELYNSRGAHWVDPTGKPEKELASTFRTKAEDTEAAGYARLATTLRELSESYEREADRVISRARTDD